MVLISVIYKKEKIEILFFPKCYFINRWVNCIMYVAKMISNIKDVYSEITGVVEIEIIGSHSLNSMEQTGE